MWLLSLFSGALLTLPVAVTVGIYVGVEWARIVQHQVGLGSVQGEGPGQIQTNTYCQKFYGIAPFPGRYVFNPNQWGDTQNIGNLCMNITTNSSVTAKDLGAAGFSATWEYPIGSVEEPVHAFPNARLDLPETLPIQLANLTRLQLNVSWTYGLGDYVHNDTNSTSLSAAEVNANVCVDMFLAANANDSTSTTASTYEVMVWLGWWGDATQPIGLASGSVANETIDGTVFTLFSGDNSLEQKVFTWVADSNTTEFDGDIAPLLTQLGQYEGPAPSDNLGYVAFGSEALSSFENVTFNVPKLIIDVQSSS